MKVIFDTQILIERKSAKSPSYFSSVVIQELVAGANDGKEIKVWWDTMHWYEANQRLLVPNSEDWFMAGKVLHAVLNDLSREDRQRRRPQLGDGKKQSIIRDTLIAVTAKRNACLVVSDNQDFPMLQRYYAFKWMSGKDFFGN